MKGNCNLELRLFHVTADSDSDQTNQYQSLEESSRSTGGKQQQLHTISPINGRVGVSDVSELQGRAIVSLATREIGESVKTDRISSRCNETSTASSPSNLSLKMSLRRFLQKRKCRIQATSPYHTCAINRSTIRNKLSGKSALANNGKGQF